MFRQARAHTICATNSRTKWNETETWMVGRSWTCFGLITWTWWTGAEPLAVATTDDAEPGVTERPSSCCWTAPATQTHQFLHSLHQREYSKQVSSPTASVTFNCNPVIVRFGDISRDGNRDKNCTRIFWPVYLWKCNRLTPNFHHSEGKHHVMTLAKFEKPGKNSHKMTARCFICRDHDNLLTG